MWSSAQNSSGVDWCRRRVRFNEVLEKVPKVPEKVWEALVQSNQVQQGSGVPAEPGRVQQGSGEVSREGSGRLWCRPRSGSIGFRWRFRWRFGMLWCKAKSGSTGFRRRLRKRRFWESLVQGRVRFNRFSRGFSALGFAARFRKICKNTTSRLLGIPPKLIWNFRHRLVRYYWYMQKHRSADHSCPLVLFFARLTTGSTRQLNGYGNGMIWMVSFQNCQWQWIGPVVGLKFLTHLVPTQRIQIQPWFIKSSYHTDTFPPNIEHPLGKPGWFLDRFSETA